MASKPLLSRFPLPAMMAYTLAIGTVPVIVPLLPLLSGQRWDLITGTGWAVLAWTVVLPVYVAWTLWNWAIGRMGVARASLFMYLVPVVAGITSCILFGEGFGPLKIAGAALVLAGLAAGRWPRRAINRNCGASSDARSPGLELSGDDVPVHGPPSIVDAAAWKVTAWPAFDAVSVDALRRK